MKKTVTVGTVLTIISSAVSYITQVIVTEIAGFSARGQIEVITSIIALASAIFSYNSYTALTLYARKYKGEPVNSKNVFNITTATQMLGAMLILYFSFDSFNGGGGLLIILIIAVAVVINNYANFNLALLNGLEKFIPSKVANSTGQMLALISIIILVRFANPSIETLVYCASFLPLVYIGICSGRLKSYYFVPQVKVIFSLKRAFLDLWPVYIISIAQLAATRLFIIYVSYTTTLDKIGSFAFANSLIQLGLFPMSMAATVIISKRKNTTTQKHKIILFAIYLLICIFGYGLIDSEILGLIPLQSFRSLNFIGDAKILIWTLPFNAIVMIVIAEAVSKQRFSNVLIITQCAMLPIAVVVYEICEMISKSNSVALAFSIATLVVSFVTLGDKRNVS